MRKTTRNILTTCLSVAASACMALSAVFAVPKVAKADNGTTVLPTDLISANGATVTANQTFNDHVEGQAVSGLGVVASGEYTAKFNTVFKGDLSLKYIFPDTDKTKTTIDTTDEEKMNAEAGNFTVTIADATEPRNYIELIYSKGSTNNAIGLISMYSIYHVWDADQNKEVVYTRVRGGGGFSSTLNFAGTGSSPLMSGFNSNRNVENELFLDWGYQIDSTTYAEDLLGVKFLSSKAVNAAYKNSFWPAILCDGESSCGGHKCGVPKFTQEGYTVSFSSTMGTDIVFTSINGVSLATTDGFALGTETYGSTTIVDNDMNVLTSNATVSMLVGEALPIKEQALVKSSALSTTTNIVYAPVLKEFAYSGNFNANTEGEYTLTYKNVANFTVTVKVTPAIRVKYLIDGSSVDEVTVMKGESFNIAGVPEALEDKIFIGWGDAEGNIFEAESEHVAIEDTLELSAVYLDITKENAALDIDNLITVNGATVTANQTFNSHTQENGVDANQDVTGLGVVASGEYSGQFNTVFNGNLSLKYLFPDTNETKTEIDSTSETMYDATSGNFKITVSSLVKPEKNYFELYFSKVTDPNNAQKDNQGQISITGKAYVNGVEYRPFRTTGGAGQYNAAIDPTTIGGSPLMSGFNSNRNVENEIILEWNGKIDNTAKGADVLFVKFLSHKPGNGAYGNNQWAAIIFDGTSSAGGHNFGIPKFVQDGYTVSFESTMGTDVVFTSINGVSLATDGKFNAGTETLGDSNVVNGFGSELQSGDTIFVARTDVAGTLDVYESAFLQVKGLSKTGATVYRNITVPFKYSGNINWSEAGEYNITSTSNSEFNLKVNVQQGVMVTYKVGETTISTMEIAPETAFMLANAPTAEQLSGKVFLGWTSGNINDSLYNAGAMHAAISETTTFTAVCVDMDMLAGAAVRKTEPTGIRFATKISESDYNMVKAVATFGTLIAPLDMVSANDLTVNTSADKCLNLVADNWLSTESAALMQLDTNGYKYFTGVMTNVYAENFARKFVAKAYVTVTYADNTTATFYADCNETDNARSIYYVADASLDDGESDGLGVLAGYVNAVADITVSGDTVSKANDTATYTVDSSVADGIFTITVSGTISALVVNGVWISSNGTVQAGDISISGAHITHNDNGTSTITFTRN